MLALVVVPVQNSTAPVTGRYPVVCDSHDFGYGLLAPDCQRAIDKLPTDDPGDIHMDLQRHEIVYPEFSVDALENRHRLPISEDVGTCGVKVHFTADFMYDHSSWRIIRLRIMDVLLTCVPPGEAGIGGSTITGAEKHVEMLLYSTTSDLSLTMSNDTTAFDRRERSSFLRV